MAAASLRQPVDMSLDELRIELIHPELTRLRNFLASAPAHVGVPRADVLALVQIAEALSLASEVMPARFSYDRHPIGATNSRASSTKRRHRLLAVASTATHSFDGLP